MSDVSSSPSSGPLVVVLFLCLCIVAFGVGGLTTLPDAITHDAHEEVRQKTQMRLMEQRIRRMEGILANDYPEILQADE